MWARFSRARPRAGQRWTGSPRTARPSRARVSAGPVPHALPGPAAPGSVLARFPVHCPSEMRFERVEELLRGSAVGVDGEIAACDR